MSEHSFWSLQICQWSSLSLYRILHLCRASPCTLHAPCSFVDTIAMQAHCRNWPCCSHDWECYLPNSHRTPSLFVWASHISREWLDARVWLKQHTVSTPLNPCWVHKQASWASPAPWLVGLTQHGPDLHLQPALSCFSWACCLLHQGAGTTVPNPNFTWL